MQEKSRNWDIAFLLFLFAVPFFSVPFHHGISIFDPANYLKSAHFLLQGRWTVEENFFANRIASCVPYAIGLSVWGVNEYLTFITTIELMALLALMYFVIGKYDKVVAFTAVLLLGTSQLVLKSASVIGSDMMIMLMANAVVLIWFYFRKQNSSSGKAILWGVLTGVTFGIAFLSKESIAFYVPLLFYFALADYRHPVLKRFWTGAGLTVAFFAAAVLVYYTIKTGDILYRLHIVEAGPSASEVNYHQSGFREILERCTYQPFQFIGRDLTFSVLFLFSVLHLFMPNRTEEQGAVKKYFLFTIIFWWFGSQSFSSWNPVGLVHRIWLPLLVPMAINAAYALRDLMLEPFDANRTEKVKYSILIVALILGAWVAFFASFSQFESINRSDSELAQLLSNTLWLTFLAALTLFFIRVKTAAHQTPLHKALVLIAILFPSMHEIHLSQVWFFVDKESRPINDFRAEKEIVSELETLHPKMILAEIVLSDNYGLYVGFDKVLPFVNYNNIHPDSIPGGTYLLLNDDRMQYWKGNLTESMGFKMQKQKIPDFAYNPEAHGFVVVRQIASSKLYQKRIADY